MHEPEKKTQVASHAQVQAPVAPTAPVPTKSAIPKKKSSARKWILISGVAVVLALAVGGYFLVGKKQNEPVQISQQPITPIQRPAPTVETIVTIVDEPVIEEPVVEPEPFPIIAVPGVDTDSDGLTDVEETTVYSTNPRLPDTDSDGFLDGNEVFHRYNPGGTAPGTLLESGLVKEQVGEMNGARYAFYHPSNWVVELDGTEFVLDTGTGEGLRVSIITKSAQQSLREFVATASTSENVRQGTTKNGLLFFQSDDQLTTYIDLNPTVGAVLVVKYETGTNARVDYLQTLQMIINSVQALGAIQEPQIGEPGV